MKTMIEYLTTMIILMVMMFSFSSIVLAEIQIIQARNEHTSIIEQLQVLDSYDENTINNFFLSKDKNNHCTYEIEDNKVFVDYTFDIVLPIIGQIKDNRIVGYAR